MSPNQSPSPTGTPAHTEEESNQSSANPSRPGSVTGEHSNHKHKLSRVKFSVGAEDDDEFDLAQQEAALSLPQSIQLRKPLPHQRAIPLIDTDASADVTDASLKAPDWVGRTRLAAETAQQKASRLANRLSRSAPGSRRNSVEPTYRPQQDDLFSLATTPLQYPVAMVGLQDIPLMDLNKLNRLERDDTRRPYSLYEDTTETDSDTPDAELLRKKTSPRRPAEEAHRLVKSMTKGLRLHKTIRERHQASGRETPTMGRYLPDSYFVAHPKEYKAGILSNLLKLHDQEDNDAASQHITGHQGKSIKKHRRPRLKHPEDPIIYHSQSDTPASGQSSGRVTPKKPKWYHETRSPNQSSSSLPQLLSSSASTGNLGTAGPGRPGLPHSFSSNRLLHSAVDILRDPRSIFKKARLEEEVRITGEIADTLARHDYLENLCRGLMLYGAPTHRLEEYMKKSALKIQVRANFLYLPGCVIMSLEDEDTHTTEVKLIRENQGVNLGKFKEVFDVYKLIIHRPCEQCEIDAALVELARIKNERDKHPVWLRVLVFGLASVAVGPFAFGARPIDFPIIFLLGCLLGFLQLVVAPRSSQFQNVFEVFAAVCTSFLARAFGSITWSNGQYVFCFSAIAQSSIALILPGYVILCASLELQSRSIIAGSVRMVYAIIYALFLGFGITIGTALFGLAYPQATSIVTCDVPRYWSNPYLTHFPFVPLFALGLIIINQAKWRQAPAMLVIAFAGYQTNYWSSRRFANNVQVSNALGALVIGTMANLYSRVHHGLAAAAMLPAIFVQVPSGLAASGSLVAGLTSADQITGNATGVTVITNGTQGFLQAQNSTLANQAVYSGTIFNVGYGMVQVAIGISVGLFLSTLVVYPLGKRKAAGKGDDGDVAKTENDIEAYSTF
jgi:uncharacterized membrane protein YjjP (DUF1212 family)